MMRLTLGLVSLAFLATIGCGGGGGGPAVDKGAYLDQLSQSDIRILCEWTADTAGEPRIVECDGFSVNVWTADECVAQWGADQPHCTVAQQVACLEAWYEDLCVKLTDLSACVDYLACKNQ